MVKRNLAQKSVPDSEIEMVLQWRNGVGIDVKY
jgi:hypothetical protein